MKTQDFMKKNMIILLISQRYNEFKSRFSTNSKKTHHSDSWISRYTTNIPISVVTSDAVVLIKNFVYNYIQDVLFIDGIERNGRTEMWEFSVITGSENMIFDYMLPVSNKVVFQLIDMAREWRENYTNKVIYSGMNVVAAGVEDGRAYAMLYDGITIKQVFIE